MLDVACVGVLCADVLVKPVDKLPPKGKLQLVSDIQMKLGGCAANAAIDLAHLGLQSAVITQVGDDGFGRFLRETLSSEGVDISGLHLAPGVATSASVLPLSADGERTILHLLGSNAVFTEADVDMGIVKKAKVLFVAGSFLMPRFDGEGAAALLQKARDHGVLCCLDTAWDATGAWMDKLGVCMPLLDWFLPSYEEAVEMSGETDPVCIAEKFIGMGSKNVVVKLGEKGCYVRPEQGEPFFSPGFKVDVLDTSGAGDSFCAGFIAGLVRGWPVETCACFANAVGAHCVGAMGTTDGVKSTEETLLFIQNQS